MPPGFLIHPGLNRAGVARRNALPCNHLHFGVQRIPLRNIAAIQQRPPAPAVLLHGTRSGDKARAKRAQGGIPVLLRQIIARQMRHPRQQRQPVEVNPGGIRRAAAQVGHHIGRHSAFEERAARHSARHVVGPLAIGLSLGNQPGLLLCRADKQSAAGKAARFTRRQFKPVGRLAESIGQCELPRLLCFGLFRQGRQRPNCRGKGAHFRLGIAQHLTAVGIAIAENEPIPGARSIHVLPEPGLCVAAAAPGLAGMSALWRVVPAEDPIIMAGVG